MGVACTGGGVMREWCEELREERLLVTEEEEGEEGTALTWVTGCTHDVVLVSWLNGREKRKRLEIPYDVHIQRRHLSITEPSIYDRKIKKASQ